jgi:2,4-dienoyl-CoA reductase-like NADH-dependent reductase (Old Yellow Enzyme family)
MSTTEQSPATSRAPAWPRVATFRDPGALRAHFDRGGIPLELDDAVAPPASSPLARPLDAHGVHLGNRFCILPMEGWDGTAEGAPSDLTTRRWRNFGRSGAKLIWGGEAVAVRHDGRANPNQLLMHERTLRALGDLRQALVETHRERFGAQADRDLYLGLQLTHSGRYARPNVKDRPEPLVASAHPRLDRRFPAGVRVLGDEELDRLTGDFVAAARRAQDLGFAFVDFKHCHGYLGHELLGARTRAGRYGGSFENRTRFLRNVVAGIRAEAKGLGIAVRLSAFDTAPFRMGADGVGTREEDASPSDPGFGLLDPAGSVRAADLAAALRDAHALLALLESLDVRFVCITAGTPYYNPHVLRPALFPPTDAYLPPEDPFLGVARQLRATAALKAAFPGLVFVGSAYTYLQEWLPHVAQRAVREGLVDVVGLGRMALSYPELPADLLSGAPLRRKLFCRTFSDCTSGPRNGLVSGCFPLDPHYVSHPDAEALKAIKARPRA